MLWLQLRERICTVTLVLSISNVEDIEVLTQLIFVVHLHIIFDRSLIPIVDYVMQSVDKSTVLSIVDNLQYFPHLESFALQAECDEWSDYDKQEVLSKIYEVTSVRDIKICFGYTWELNPPSSFRILSISISEELGSTKIPQNYNRCVYQLL